MEMKKEKIKEIIEKIGLGKLILLVLAGVVLLVLSLPGNSIEKDEKKSDENSYTQEEIAIEGMEKYIKDKERDVEEILAKVDGVGDVKVMITLSKSQEKVPLENDDVTEDDLNEKDNGGGNRVSSKYANKSECVLISKEGEDTPYVVQLNAPEIEGVVVVAVGARKATVQTEIIEAIQALFSIEPHKIKVMKME